ncbi:MAG: XRE family transcriptional regulator [Rhizobiales bacterium]|nr:XRE family transcriptional regulator [Hyphomicrobiales bacterium]
MSGKISGRLIAAARALTGISLADFAEATGLPSDAVGLMEAGGSALLQSDRDIEAVSRGLERFGVIIIDESNGMGAGVRLKFTRQDARQIARLEGEGGIVGSDDAP